MVQVQCLPVCAGETINPSGALALPRDGRTITLWNYDVAAFNAGVNLYGSHPFLLQLHQGAAHTLVLAPESLSGIALGQRIVLRCQIVSLPHR